MNVEEKLKQKLDGSLVKKNEDGMSYLETWNVIELANEIFGHNGWSNETVVNEVAYESESMITYKAVSKVCAVIDGVKAFHSGTGFATHDKNKGVEKAHEIAGKNAEADSLKRAMYKFGYPLGLALYDSSQKNVQNLDNNSSGTSSHNINNQPQTQSSQSNQPQVSGQTFENKSSQILDELRGDVASWIKQFKESGSRKDMVMKYHSVENKWRSLTEDDYITFNEGFRKVLETHFPKQAAGMS